MILQKPCNGAGAAHDACDNACGSACHYGFLTASCFSLKVLGRPRESMRKSWTIHPVCSPWFWDLSTLALIACVAQINWERGVSMTLCTGIPRGYFGCLACTHVISCFCVDRTTCHLKPNDCPARNSDATYTMQRFYFACAVSVARKNKAPKHSDYNDYTRRVSDDEHDIRTFFGFLFILWDLVTIPMQLFDIPGFSGPGHVKMLQNLQAKVRAFLPPCRRFPGPVCRDHLLLLGLRHFFKFYFLFRAPRLARNTLHLCQS